MPIMGRPCPVCKRGMFKEKKLKRHIRIHHPDYYETWIENRGKTSKAQMEKAEKKKGG